VAISQVPRRSKPKQSAEHRSSVSGVGVLTTFFYKKDHWRPSEGEVDAEAHGSVGQVDAGLGMLAEALCLVDGTEGRKSTAGSSRALTPLTCRKPGRCWWSCQVKGEKGACLTGPYEGTT
jgi:hypothetical protein